MATAETKIVVRGENKTGATFRKVKSDIGGLRTALGGLAGIIGVGMFGRLVKDSLEAGDAVQKMAARTGASTEALSQLRHAAELSGSNLQTLEKGVKAMQRSASEAADGMKSYADAYNKLGINVDEFIKLKPEQQLSVMAEALSKVDNVTERTALAMDTMGRAGTELLPMFQGGAAGLDAMRAEADKLGLTLDQASADSMAAAVDGLTRMSRAGDNLKLALARGLGPTIAELSNWFADNLPTAVDFAGKAFNNLRAVAVRVAAYFFKLIEWAGELGHILPDALGGEALLQAGARAGQVYTDLIALSDSYFETTDKGKRATFDLGEQANQTRAALEAYNPALRGAAEATAEVGKKSKKAAEDIEVFKYGIQSNALSLRQLQEQSMQDLEEQGGTFGVTWDYMQNKTKESTENMTDFANDAARDMQGAFKTAFFDVMQGNFSNLESTFVSTITNMASEFLSSQLMNFLNIGGGGGGFASLLSFLPGFATGGSFKVGGAGGTDSRLVAFRATPGEQVTVTPPGAEPPATARPVMVNMTVNTPDAGSFRRSQNQVLTQLQAGLAAARRIQ